MAPEASRANGLPLLPVLAGDPTPVVVVVSLKNLNISEDGEITGLGKDSKGNYTVYGNLDIHNDNVTLTKYYQDSYIEFSGSYSGSSIKGKWSVYPGLYYSGFTLTNT